MTAAQRLIHVMGTVVSVVVRPRSVAPPAVAEAIDEVEALLHEVDAVFSTWRPESPMSRLQRGETTLADCPPDVAEVLRLCAAAERTTDGWFSPAYAGGQDPTGLVKGWAVREASRLLTSAGLHHHAVGAGGDVACSGAADDSGRAWRVGVADPHQPGRVCAVVEVGDGAVATSGPAERGAHVLDPTTGRPARGLASATVVGPDLALADAYATALIAGGRPDPAWLHRVAGYEALTVSADGRQWRGPGFRDSSGG